MICSRSVLELFEPDEHECRLPLRPLFLVRWPGSQSAKYTIVAPLAVCLAHSGPLVRSVSRPTPHSGSSPRSSQRGRKYSAIFLLWHRRASRLAAPTPCRCKPDRPRSHIHKGRAIPHAGRGLLVFARRLCSLGPRAPRGRLGEGGAPRTSVAVRLVAGSLALPGEALHQHGHPTTFSASATTSFQEQDHSDHAQSRDYGPTCSRRSPWFLALVGVLSALLLGLLHPADAQGGGRSRPSVSELRRRPPGDRHP